MFRLPFAAPGLLAFAEKAPPPVQAEGQRRSLTRYSVPIPYLPQVVAPPAVKSRPGAFLLVVGRSTHALDQASSVAQKTLSAKL